MHSTWPLQSMNARMYALMTEYVWPNLAMQEVSHIPVYDKAIIIGYVRMPRICRVCGELEETHD